MKTLNLDSLLADLEKVAGIEKVASATPEVKPNVSAELSSILEKKAEEDITASALAAGEQLAKQLIEKMAAENVIQEGNDVIVAADNAKILPTETGGTIDGVLEGTVEKGLALGAKSDDVVDKLEDGAQTKEAQTKLENEEMANKIMQKIAQTVGEATTSPAAGVNVAAAAAPNMIQAANAVMTAADDAKVLPLPGAEGTLNNILEAVVARAEAQGAVSDDLVNGDKPASGAEGGSTLSPEQEQQKIASEDEIEKAAAVSALVEAGCDFNSAVDMVKEAEEKLAAEADQQEKVAAVSALIEAGYSWDDSVAMVKKAEEELAAEATKGDSREQEKQAAFQALVEAGVDFDQATAMVKQAEEDVYGK